MNTSHFCEREMGNVPGGWGDGGREQEKNSKNSRDNEKISSAQ